MSITQFEIDQLIGLARATYGGVKEDYFGLLYLEHEFKLPRDVAATQNAFGANDYGIDGFHIDTECKNLYLLQFKWTQSYSTFKESYERLISVGMERIFGNLTQDQKLNSLAVQLKSRLLNDMALIDRVFVRFVFTGNAEDAERSTALQTLREDLESKKYLIDQFFDRPMSLVIEYRSTKTGMIAGLGHQHKTHTYTIDMTDTLSEAVRTVSGCSSDSLGLWNCIPCTVICGSASSRGIFEPVCRRTRRQSGDQEVIEPYRAG